MSIDTVKMNGIVISSVANVEKVLRRNGAQGKGLKELLDSIRDKLPGNIIEEIEKCIPIRNKIAHNGSATERDVIYILNNIDIILDFFGEENSHKYTLNSKLEIYIKLSKYRERLCKSYVEKQAEWERLIPKDLINYLDKNLQGENLKYIESNGYLMKDDIREFFDLKYAFEQHIDVYIDKNISFEYLLDEELDELTEFSNCFGINFDSSNIMKLRGEIEKWEEERQRQWKEEQQRQWEEEQRQKEREQIVEEIVQSRGVQKGKEEEQKQELMRNQVVHKITIALFYSLLLTWFNHSLLEVEQLKTSIWIFVIIAMISIFINRLPADNEKILLFIFLCVAISLIAWVLIFHFWWIFIALPLIASIYILVFVILNSV